MPIYEFKCDNCGKITEQLSNNNKLTIIKCPECDLGTATKIISVVEFNKIELKSQRIFGHGDSGIRK